MSRVTPPRSGRATAAAGAALLLAMAAAGTGAVPSPARPVPRPPGFPSVRLGVPGAVNNGVSVAAAGSRVVVTWAARSESSTDVYAALSGDGGASFDVPIRVNDVPGDARVSGEQAPRVALGSGVRLVWVSRQGGVSVIRTAATRPGERVFAPAATVHAESLTGARGWASLAVDGEDGVHVAWLDGRGDGDRAPAAASPAPAHKAMRQDLFQAVWRADGARAETRVATDVCFCCKTAVATARDGSVYVAWRHIYPPNLRDMAVARSTDGGRTFGTPVRVSEDGWALDGCPDDGPSMAVDARGVVHIVWPTRVSATGKGVFYSSSADGGRSFAPRLRLDEGLGGAAHPQVAAVGEDRLVAVWDQGGGEGPRRVVLREIRRDPHRAEGTPRLVPGTILSAAQAAVYPAVAGAATGSVVAWTEESGTGSEIVVRRLPR